MTSQPSTRWAWSAARPRAYAKPSRFSQVWFRGGWLTFALLPMLGAAQDPVFRGAGEQTPSRAHYFSWINHAWEGSTEARTLINLDFFTWLRDEY